MRGLAAYLKLARLENSLLPLIALAAGFTIAGATDYRRLALTALVLLLVHSVVTIWNDIADEVGDRHNAITRVADLKKSGSYNALRGLIGGSVGIIVAASLFLPNTTKLLVGATLLLGWAYNVHPIRASRRPILSITLLSLAYGAVPFLLGASLGTINWPVMYLALGWTIGRGALSLLKDYKDARGDAATDKRTFLLVYGGTLTAKLSFTLALISYLTGITVVSSQVRHDFTAVLLLGVVAMWLLYERSKLFRAKKYPELNQIFHECIRYQIIFDGLVIVCLRTL